MKVKLIRHTPDPEKLIASSAKLCYSKVGVEEIEDKLTDENVKRFLNMLMGVGHDSPIEHANFTFSIEGVSRTLLAQLTRHRIASYSVQSQRYVSMNQFEYIIPSAIESIPYLKNKFIKAMEKDQAYYNEFVKHLLIDKIFNWRSARNKMDTSKYESINEEINTFKSLYPKDYKILEKQAIEDARYVLPNACETKIVMTMNARALFNFFSHRCCCFDNQTEVLTNVGWKLFKDINNNDLIYSLNLESGESELSRIKEQFEYDYDGNMIRISSQAIDQLITPNHKIPVSYSYDNKKYILDFAYNHEKHKMILMKKNCKPIKGIKPEMFKIEGITTKNKNQYAEWNRIVNGYNVKTSDLFRFLGMYISDGYCYKSDYHYNIGISKGDENLIDYYKELLEKLTNNKVRKFKDRSSWKIECHDRILYKFFNPLGKSLEKHIPNFVWEYDSSLLHDLFLGLCDGDTTKKEKGKIHYTSSKKLTDDFQRLMLHLGYSSTIGVDNRIGNVSEGLDAISTPYKITTKNIGYRNSINQNKNEPIIKTTNRDAFSTEYYKGKVNCLELERNNILYVRRNGKASWSGNSRAQSEIRQLADLMLTECKKVAPTLFKYAGAPCINGSCPEGEMTCGKPKR